MVVVGIEDDDHTADTDTDSRHRQQTADTDSRQQTQTADRAQCPCR